MGGGSGIGLGAVLPITGRGEWAPGGAVWGFGVSLLSMPPRRDGVAAAGCFCFAEGAGDGAAACRLNNWRDCVARGWAGLTV